MSTINLSIKIKSFTTACGKKSVLETRKNVLHGINPTLTYISSGKTFKLPRFFTFEMKEARQMNKIAIKQLKYPPNLNFSQAIEADLKRLTSVSFEDAYSRVRWTNPKDGRIYYILKEGVSKDGQVKIRILNQDGAFVKNATVTPKKIAIFDHFALPSESEKLNGKIEHGDMVKAFAQRNNPFADYTFINLDGRDDWFDFDDSHSEKVMTIFEQSGIKNKHLDYLSISLGRDVSVFSEKTFEEQKHVASREPKNHFIYFLKEMADKKNVFLLALEMKEKAMFHYI